MCYLWSEIGVEEIICGLIFLFVIVQAIFLVSSFSTKLKS